MGNNALIAPNVTPSRPRKDTSGALATSADMAKPYSEIAPVIRGGSVRKSSKHPVPDHPVGALSPEEVECENPS